jgi:hypothetical protein
MALSKLKRVRVEGSKNNVAMTFPSSSFLIGCFSNSTARSRTFRISSVEKSSIETKLLFFIMLAHLELTQNLFQIYSRLGINQISVDN